MSLPLSPTKGRLLLPAAQPVPPGQDVSQATDWLRQGPHAPHAGETWHHCHRAACLRLCKPFKRFHLGTADKTYTATEPLRCCCRALTSSCACGWPSGSVCMSAMETSTGPGPAGPMWQTSPVTIPAGGRHCLCTLRMLWCPCKAYHSSRCCVLMSQDCAATQAWQPAGNSNAPESMAAKADACTSDYCVLALSVGTFQALRASLLCWCRQFVALALEYLSRLSYPTYLTNAHSQVGVQAYL